MSEIEKDNFAYTLITGGSGVLGTEFAKIYLSKGENVLLTGRSEEKLENIKNSFSTKQDVLTFSCDLDKAGSRENLFEFIRQKGIIITRIIHCAGNDNQKAFGLFNQKSLITQIRANYEAPLSITLFCLQNFPVKEILAVSSLTAIVPMPYFATYTSSKRALWDFFTAIKRENKNVKITVALFGSVPTREDIKADIKKQGLTGKLSSQSPEKVVRKSVKALEKDKDKVIVGFYNKLLYFFNKITPLKLKQKIIAKKFKNKTKENF